MGGLDAGDLGGVDAAHLPGAYTKRHALAAKHDGVALDELGHLPGKQQIGPLLRSWRSLGGHFQAVWVEYQIVCRLHEQARANALAVGPWFLARRRALWQGNAQHPGIGFGRKHFERFRAELGRNQHFDELFGDQARRLAIHRHIESDDPAKGRGRVRLQGLLISLCSARSEGHATGIGVLDDHTSSRCVVGIKALHTFPGRIGVGDVVVRQLLALELRCRDQRARSRLCLAVQRGALVGVLTVAQVLHLDPVLVALGRVFALCAIGRNT